MENKKNKLSLAINLTALIPSVIFGILAIYTFGLMIIFITNYYSVMNEWQETLGAATVNYANSSYMYIYICSELVLFTIIVIEGLVTFFSVRGLIKRRVVAETFLLVVSITNICIALLVFIGALLTFLSQLTKHNSSALSSLVPLVGSIVLMFPRGLLSVLIINRKRKTKMEKNKINYVPVVKPVISESTRPINNSKSQNLNRVVHKSSDGKNDYSGVGNNFCSYCGAKITGAEEFCGACGRKVDL